MDQNYSDIDQRDALMELLAPDGYYTYLGLNKATVVAKATTPSAEAASSSGGGLTAPNKVGEIDADAVKKAYRKLSRKHHPDKGGDAETFKVLARAYRVLLNPKLREQYDILGIDLDDDAAHNDNGTPSDENGDGTHADASSSSTAQGIVQEIASMALTSIIQLVVRTAMLGLVAVLLIRYSITFYPILAFLGYIALQIAGKARVRGGSVYETNNGAQTQMTDVLSPLSIAVGLILMRSGRDETTEWSWVFWLGESMVIVLFFLNSVESIPRNLVGIGAISVLAGLMALWFRGKFWNYAIVIGFEAFMAIFVALSFPVMEMVLEAVLNEKLKKVGDSIRSHHRQMEAYYAHKNARSAK